MNMRDAQSGRVMWEASDWGDASTFQTEREGAVQTHTVSLLRAGTLLVVWSSCVDLRRMSAHPIAAVLMCSAGAQGDPQVQSGVA